MAVTLQALVTNAAYALDDLKPYTVGSGTGTTVVSNGLGNLTANASTSTYDGAWAYCNNQQMRVRTGGYIPGTGSLTITPGWTVVPTTGQTLYVTRRFPIGPSATPGEDTPYQWFVQESLKHLVDRDVITLAITSADAYSLATYQFWLDRQERLIGIREPAPISGRRAVDASWRRPRIEREGTTVYLKLDAPFASGVSGNLTLDVLRPAFTLVSGSESTTGPTADAQTVEANPDDVQTGVLAFIYFALANRQQSSPDGANWAAMYAAQKAEFEGLAAFDRTRSLPPAPAQAEAA